MRERLTVTLVDEICSLFSISLCTCGPQVHVKLMRAHAGIMSAVFFGHTITANFCLGISIVFISMHQFFTDGARKSVHDGTGNAKIHASPSMEHIKDVPALSRSSSLNGSFAERERLLARPGLPPLPPLLPR